MTTLTGGELVAQSLVANGVDTLFGIPGVQLDPIFAGLHDVQDTIRIIHARHEQGVALMAFGYAHASRKTAVVLVVPGPGFLNATTGLLVAHACNTPLLCLAGQSERQFIGSGVGVLHELDNQIGIARSLTKWVERVEDPALIGSLMVEAIMQTQQGRTRPVYLELPSDIVRMNVAAGEVPVARVETTRPDFDDAAVDQLAQALAAAQCPLIIAGGGATHAGEEIRALAEMLGAPVGMTENGLGTLDCTHPLAFSQIGANKFWGRADVALALGSRLYAPVFNWGWDDDLAIYKVDIDDSELDRLPAPIHGIHGEVAAVVDRLLDVLPQYLTTRVDLSGAIAEVNAEREDMLAPHAEAADILSRVRQSLGEDGILVVDVTQLNHACLELLPVHKPRTYVSSGYQGALGFGPCTAMGMKVAKPDVPVVCMVGDGGFMYAAQELATAVQFDIPVIMLIMNDGSYKNVEGILNRAYGGRAVATTLKNPDFCQFAESFGVEAQRVTTPKAMQTALDDYIARNVPALIDYRMGAIESPFWLRFLPQVRKQVPPNDYGLVKK